MKKNSPFKVRTLGLAVAAVLVTGTFCTTSFAESNVTSELAVSATVVSACTLSSSAAPFNNVDLTNNATLSTTATLTVQCTKGSSANIALNEGSHPDSGSSADVPLRNMVNGSDGVLLAYTISQDAGNSTNWGYGLGNKLAYTGEGISVEKNVYLAITPGQNKAVGSYSDTVVASISF